MGKVEMDVTVTQGFQQRWRCLAVQMAFWNSPCVELATIKVWLSGWLCLIWNPMHLSWLNHPCTLSLYCLWNVIVSSEHTLTAVMWRPPSSVIEEDVPLFLKAILVSGCYQQLKGSEAKWSNPRPPWLYPPETKMLSKSVSRAGENSVIWKFEHFSRREYPIFFFFFIFWAFQAILHI